MKDYYAVLEVEASAEQAVIDAAYRRLMRKYHPDVLAREAAQDAEALRQVQEINEAYEVLGDVERRLAYDLRRTPIVIDEGRNGALHGAVERVFYLVKCSKTRGTFKMTLQRRSGDTGPFKVTALERVYGKVSPEQSNALATLYEQAHTLGMAEIDWAGFKCPDCKGEVRNANGTFGNWSRCSKCLRLGCVGKMEKRRDGNYLFCPWCGEWSMVTGSVATGAKVSAPLGGRVDKR